MFGALVGRLFYGINMEVIHHFWGVSGMYLIMIEVMAWHGILLTGCKLCSILDVLCGIIWWCVILTNLKS